jgi:hypothetical protein
MILSWNPLGTILWVGFIIVNLSLSQSKGCRVWVILLVSIVAAPLVYLYLLALPGKSDV